MSKYFFTSIHIFNNAPSDEEIFYIHNNRIWIIIGFIQHIFILPVKLYFEVNINLRKNLNIFLSSHYGQMYKR